MLVAAARDGDLARVRLELEKGARVDVRDEAGDTPLSFAVRNSHIEVANYLVTHGAAVDGRSWNGFTPLFFAAINEDERIISFLSEHGANVNAKDNDGLTPIWHLLCRELPEHSDRYLVKSKALSILLERGAEVNIAGGPMSLSPLHCAVGRGDPDAIGLLLKRGAQVAAVDGQGRRAADIARQRGFLDATALLSGTNQRASAATVQPTPGPTASGLPAPMLSSIPASACEVVAAGGFGHDGSLDQSPNLKVAYDQAFIDFVTSAEKNGPFLFIMGLYHLQRKDYEKGFVCFQAAGKHKHYGDRFVKNLLAPESTQSAPDEDADIHMADIELQGAGHGPGQDNSVTELGCRVQSLVKFPPDWDEYTLEDFKAFIEHSNTKYRAYRLYKNVPDDRIDGPKLFIMGLYYLTTNQTDEAIRCLSNALTRRGCSPTDLQALDKTYLRADSKWKTFMILFRRNSP